jgi:hypothetical protein
MTRLCGDRRSRSLLSVSGWRRSQGCRFRTSARFLCTLASPRIASGTISGCCWNGAAGIRGWMRTASWLGRPRRESRLSGLDVPARRFLSHGGEYAHDVVDRSLDLLERLGEPDPHLDGIRLPAYIIEATQNELATGRMDVSVARRRAMAGHGRQQRPRIGLDPFGEGVRVILPAVGGAPDGIAVWRVTADGIPGTVQSQALWVGTSEAAPETTFPLPRPVRSVLVSLSGRDLTAELQVVEPADPILFFADDGRQIPGSLSLPRGQVWILHPADRELVVTGEVGDVAEPPVPFGWEGWRLRLVSVDNAQAVSLHGGRSHPVHGQARPRLLLNDPVRGVTTPYGSPVYEHAPRLFLPGTPEAPISWHVDVRPARETRTCREPDHPIGPALRRILKRTWCGAGRRRARRDGGPTGTGAGRPASGRSPRGRTRRRSRRGLRPSTRPPGRRLRGSATHHRRQVSLSEARVVFPGGSAVSVHGSRGDQTQGAGRWRHSRCFAPASWV